MEAAWSEYAEGMSGEIDVEENARSRNLSVKVWAFMRLTAKKSFAQPVWDTETTQLFRTRFKAVSPNAVDTPGHGYWEPFFACRCGG